MENYKVTIAMPVYNVEDRVKVSLLSALDQTFGSIEYLIIDDKGNDNSINVVKDVIRSHSRGCHVKIIDHITNQGTGATKNTAIHNATGKYLYFMDSDDFITKDCIQVLYDLAESKGAEVTCGSYSVLNEDFSFKRSFFVGSYNAGNSLFKHVYENGNRFPVETWNKLYLLSFLKENSIYCIPHHLCEDVFFTFQVIQKCKRYALSNNISYLYILYSNSATTGTGDYRYKFSKMYVEAMEAKFEYMKKHKIDKLEFVCYELLRQYQFIIGKIRTSSNINNDEKYELLSRIKKNIEIVLSTDLFKRYKYLCANIDGNDFSNLLLDFQGTNIIAPKNKLNIDKIFNSLTISLCRLKNIVYTINKFK